MNAVAFAWSKRTVLRAGYGAVIVVLVLSAVEAYHIQTTVSQQHLEIYRHFVEQDDALTLLRRNLWLASIYVRDYFIDPTQAQGTLLLSQLDVMERENEGALQVLDRAANHRKVVPQIRRSLGEFWALIRPIPETMAHATDKAQMAFLQGEIVPRRGDLYNVLRDLTAADQQRLQNSEGEFAGTRRRAAEGLLMMLVSSVLLCILVARLSLRHAENLERQAEENFAQVAQAKAELQQLSARLLEIEEEGRRKLSRELHDEIGQTLALLQIEISHAQALLAGTPVALKARLDRARELAERTVQTIRNISVLLRPALLDDLGLVPALQFQLEDFLRRSGIQCEFVEDGVADHLPDAVKTCVYRVVQEALHNCEKHSGARKVRVTVRQLPACLVTEIEDDGRGFQTDAQRGAGLGLLGIRERAANAGGSLVIDSAPGRGARIALRIPLEAVEAHA
ncbi:MAG TPA: sensor histidine kinase [Candidatus Acidoferrales bacterium]|nr:sensor histidine kinase [Candidatus Acidoferrales bacterium]